MKKKFDSAFWKHYMSLAFPVMLQCVITNSFSLVDSLMVSSLGEMALSSVTVAASWGGLCLNLCSGFSGALAVFTAQYYGVRTWEKMRKSFGLALTVVAAIILPATLLSLLAPGWIVSLFNDEPELTATAISYLKIIAISYPGSVLSGVLSARLRATERMRIPMVASFVAMGMNVVGNYVLIFGKCGLPVMGIRGAAIASVIAAWSQPLVMCLVGRLKGKHLESAGLPSFRFERELTVAFIKKAAPIVANLSIYTLAHTVITAVFCRMSAENMAAVSIARNLHTFCWVVHSGMAAAADVIMGVFAGQGRIREMRHTGNRIIIAEQFMGMLLAGLLILFRRPFVELFDLKDSLTEATKALALSLVTAHALRTFMCSPYSTVMDSFFRAAGNPTLSALIDILAMWLVAVPAALIGSRVAPDRFLLVYCIVIFSEDLVKIPAVFWIYFKTTKWIKPVTEEGKAGLARYLAEKEAEKAARHV